jgi:hypothetical protein
MQIAIEILIVLACLVFPAACGLAEAWYYFVRNKTAARDDLTGLGGPIGSTPLGIKIVYPTNKQEKTVLNIIRILFYGLVLLSPVGWAKGLGLVLLFSLIHDGIYYVVRERLQPGTYPLGFFDFGNSAPQGIDLNLWKRLTIATLGILIYFYFLIWPL